MSDAFEMAVVMQRLKVLGLGVIGSGPPTPFNFCRRNRAKIDRGPCGPMPSGSDGHVGIRAGSQGMDSGRHHASSRCADIVIVGMIWNGYFFFVVVRPVIVSLSD